jgi:outer membrane protein OmpA-like peptidoglycan-associated protein
MKRISARIRWVVAAVLPLAVVAGCASAEKEQAARAQLERAQAAYRQAQADPNVQAYAQIRLADAQKAMQAAEQAKDLDDIQQLGYLAEKKAQIASLAGASRKAEQDAQQLSKETSDVILQKRERELRAARSAAEAKGREADQARAAAEARLRDAEAKAREAEQARAQVEAEAKARAAEQARSAALTKELSDLKAKQTDLGIVLTVGDVLFATGKAEVAAGGLRSIDKLAEFLKKNPNRNLLIEGHTDNTGNEDFNLKLSQQRADAVRDQLVSRGIAPERITTRGYGPKYPAVDNDSSAGRQQNRRVEVLVLNEGVSAESAAR